jgi:hypothetical protein
MPPEPLCSADCASASQFDEVLEAIDGIDAMVDSSVLPEVLATSWLVEADPSVEADELPRNELG